MSKKKRNKDVDFVWSHNETLGDYKAYNGFMTKIRGHIGFLRELDQYPTVIRVTKVVPKKGVPFIVHTDCQEDIQADVGGHSFSGMWIE